MKTYLDICDVKNSQKHGENCKKYHFQPHFKLFLQNHRN